MESSQELATLIFCLQALALVPFHSVGESFELNPLFSNSLIGYLYIKYELLGPKYI